MPTKQVSKGPGTRRTAHGRKTRSGEDRRGRANQASNKAGSGQGKAKN